MELVDQLRALLPQIDAALLTEDDRMALIGILRAVHQIHSADGSAA